MSQTIFNLNNPNLYKGTDYFVSPCNKEAFDIVHQRPIIHWGMPPYPYTILISGSKASGKTYLAHLWCQTTRIAKFSDSIDGLQNINDHNYIIENCEQWDEEELLHAFNILNNAKKYLLLTASSSWRPILPDLVSRINSVKMIQLTPPDEEMVKVLLISEFSKRSMQVSSEILTFLTYRLPRDYECIKQTVTIIDDYCLAHQKKITIPAIKESIKF